MPKVTLQQERVDNMPPSTKMVAYYDKKFPAFFLRVYPSGKRVFNVRFQHQGLRQLHRLGDAADMSVSEARAAANALIEKVRYGVEKDAPLSTLTLSAFAEEFFPRYARHWKASTLHNNRQGFERHIEPVLGKAMVATLTRQQVERWFSGMSATKGMANTMLPLLSVMMQQAETYGYRAPQSNPCKSFKRYTLVACERYLTPDELRRLWSVLDIHQASSPTAVMILRLLILTGCRGNEVRTVKWRHYRQGHWYLPDSKTGAKTVFLSSFVRELLDDWPSTGAYLFAGKQSGEPFEYFRLVAVWHQVREVARLTDVRLHDLRHTYASIALQDKVSLLSIGRLLGHSLPETTLKYAHLAKGDIQNAANNVANVIAGGMQS
ncbi:integrase [Photobacterium frigidiphilum]|uniref:Integrase n=1 Tax=Photobacterium frigidiphilum TaxID=264736 RepID=A0A2T3J5Q9_9GAMM|nr:site-specific integrase [Photobacterium frigidiphilum]PSU41549.1 integrase [Photobacterium frigidiphilum]